MTFVSRTALAITLSTPLLAVAASPSSTGQFTLDQIMGAPFNSGLIAAPIGNKLAWISNVDGRRNLWVAVSTAGNAEYHARPITSYDKDDGQEISGLSWSPDATSIAFTRGGGPHGHEKMSPNPALLPQGIEQEVWTASLNEGAPRKVGRGHSAVFSPMGDRLAWVLDGQIWAEDLGSATPRPAQLLHTLGRSKSLTWSPDGSQLAFVSDRGSHGFIGVYSFATNTLRYLDPGTDHDRYPVWSPDGREIAFIRVPYSKVENFDRPQRSGRPWSIRVASATTGEGRQVWTAQPGPGSVFHELDSGPQLFWTQGNHLIFPWEGDGWSHLYSVPAGGGAATLLTPGDFEVESAALGPDRKRLVYVSNQNDNDRRHLWGLAADGNGTPTQLTQGDGIEVAPVFASDGHTIALLHSDARIPMQPAILRSGGRIVDLAPGTLPKSFPAAQLVVPQPVVFSATDGWRIQGQLFLPQGGTGCSRHPAVVFVHGGPQRQMLLGWHPMGYYANSYALNQYLANHGYIVLSINYRSGTGHGLDFREARDYGATGASEFRDVAGAALYLRGRCDVDAAHIGIWGGSWGGFLTALALARASDLFAAGVDMSGVHDWNIDHPDNFAISDTAADPNARWRLAWQSSPLAFIGHWRSPVLLIQGDDDRDVPFLQTVELYAALQERKVEVQELVFPDEAHDFLLHRDWVAAYAATVKFFDQHLKEVPADAH
jgi:dipeptidyl aminopeptidase/acylaminoacyl peptidase